MISRFYLPFVILLTFSFFLSTTKANILMNSNLSISPPQSPPTCSSSSPPIRGAYWPSWSFRTLPPSSIEFSYFTHVYYAFVEPDPSTFELTITPFVDEWLANLTAAAHGHQQPIKALLSIGGGDANRTTFVNLVANCNARSAFIESSIAVARKYNLDGLDFDWEFPANREQMSRLGELFAEWRAAIDREAESSGGTRPRLLLTSAVYFSADFYLSRVLRNYPAFSIAANLDWINAMCYDYHGSWNTNFTGAPAALYDPVDHISTSRGISSWIAAGVPAEKVVMGIPLYGHTWLLKNASNHGIGAPAVGKGPEKGGVMVYGKIVEFNGENNATVVRDETTVSVYSYTQDEWIGYDDEWSVETKLEFAKGLQLGGYFFWALGFDHQSCIPRRAWSTWKD